jgi:hypothetical protein
MQRATGILSNRAIFYITSQVLGSPLQPKTIRLRMSANICDACRSLLSPTEMLTHIVHMMYATMTTTAFLKTMRLIGQ